MIVTFAKQSLSCGLSVLLVFTTAPLQGFSQQPSSATQAGAPEQSAGGPEQGAPLSADELEQLVAPIALYPDELVAQVLGASTFPDQVKAADSWLQQNNKLKGNDLMKAVDQQPWDPGVKALTQFPSILDNMTKNLSWTSALGEAYSTQSKDVMAAVQTMRAKAKDAGNLKSGSQIKVVQESPQTIVIQPANPQVVYVPQYNPTVIYGVPVQTPDYSTEAVVATGLISFGLGIAVGAAINNNCCGWGWGYWGTNWHGGTVVYNRNAYYGNTAWRGGRYGSSVTAYGPYGAARAGTAYNPANGARARGGTVATPSGTRSAAAGYNPSTGTYARGASGAGPNGAAAAGRAYNPRTGNYAGGVAAEGANGNRYAASSNGNVYKNTGSGWQQTQRGSSAFGGGGDGWQARQASARGSVSRGGGGGRSGR